MDKLEKIMKKSKPNKKILVYALKTRAKKSAKKSHHKLNLRKLLKHHKNKKSNHKKLNPNSIQGTLKALNKNGVKKLSHKQLHTLLNCLSKVRKKASRKFKGKEFGLTLLAIFQRYIDTAKGGQKVLIKKEINSKLKSLSRKIKLK